MKTIKIKYIAPKGGEMEMELTSDGTDGVEQIAAILAEDEFLKHHPHLTPQNAWPRVYRIYYAGRWQNVSVTLDYEPCFSCELTR